MWLILSCIFTIFLTRIPSVNCTVARGAPVYVPGKDIGGTISGCPCFFDPDGTKTGLVSANGCPCCPKNYLPCGYPNYKRCYKKNYYDDGDRGGCVGMVFFNSYFLTANLVGKVLDNCFRFSFL